MTETGPWRVDIGEPAEDDFAAILNYTLQTYGERQAAIYEDTLLAAIEALSDGPDILGCKKRDDISVGLRTLHVARQGRRGRHLIMLRIEPPRTIRVLRILHDGMDFARHVPPSP